MTIRSNARSAADVLTPTDLLRVFARRLTAARIPWRGEGMPDPTIYLRNPERDEERAGLIWRLTRQEVLA